MWHQIVAQMYKFKLIGGINSYFRSLWHPIREVVLHFLFVFQFIDRTETYFFRKGSAFLSQAKEPSDMVTAESKRLNKINNQMEKFKQKLEHSSASIRQPKQQRMVKSGQL